MIPTHRQQRVKDHFTILVLQTSWLVDDVLSEDPFNVGRNARPTQNKKESWLFAGASFSFQAVNQYIKRLLLLLLWQIKGSAGSSVALGWQQEGWEICFEEKCLKHLELEREWQATTQRILCNFFPSSSSPSLTMDCSIHSLSLSEPHITVRTKRGWRSHYPD